ncbi:MAG TPA: FCD domain-containing protein [Acidimicrobiales bacterium]|nr:FCD domain-containing protein [Acidimicrobiales bacterium]
MSPAPGPRSPDRARKVAEVVARRILLDAEELGLGPGDQLMAETKMMEIYSAGRASVREALRILEVQGVVSIRTGRGGGPVLERLKTRDVGDSLKLYLQQRHATYGDVLVARKTMDPQVGWHAATSATRSDKQVLRRMLDEIGALPAADHHLLGSSSQRFFAAMGAAAHNPVLSLLSQALRDIYSWRVHGWFDDDQYWKGNLVRLQQLLGMIEAGDADAAERTIQRELAAEVSFARRYFPDVLSERVEWD